MHETRLFSPMEEHKSMKSEDQKLLKEVHVVKISLNFIFGFCLPLGTMLHFFSLSCDSVSPTDPHNHPLQRNGCCGHGCLPSTCWEERFPIIRLGLKPNDNDQLQQFSWGCTWSNLGRRVSYVKTQHPKVWFLILSWNLS